MTHRFTRLESAAVLRFEGRDVLAFLQSKLTCDTRRWRMSGGSYGIAVDIQARVLFDGFFVLDGAAVLAIVDGAVADAAMAHLDRYVIMEDVRMARVDDLTVFRVFGEAPAAALGLAADLDPPTQLVAWAEQAAGRAFSVSGSAGEPRAYVLVAPGAAAACRGALETRGLAEATLGELEGYEVQHGVPVLGADIEVDRTIPLEAGLWAGVSLSKGCYLGQEVLERMFSRGAAARRLVRLRWDGPPADPGAALVMSAGGDGEGDAAAGAGFVTRSVAAEGGAVALAWLRRRALENLPAVALAASGAPVTFEGFVGGETPEAP